MLLDCLDIEKEVASYGNDTATNTEQHSFESNESRTLEVAEVAGRETNVAGGQPSNGFKNDRSNRRNEAAAASRGSSGRRRQLQSSDTNIDGDDVIPEGFTSTLGV